MIGLWLHEMGARVVAFPFRIVIGLVFINIGLQSMGALQAGANSAPLLDLTKFGLGDLGSMGIGGLLVLAGLLSIAGVFVRIIGGVLFFIVISNMFAGFGSLEGGMAETIQLLQNRLLLAVCAMVLFFLGSGMFSLDGIIFRTIGGLGGDDEEGGKRKKGGH
ncbi:MAG: hypothetical protein AB7K09_20890 [Planctomycetota bacterium]